MRGGGASSATIPPGARKLVQVVKEVATGHGDDEIFAMLQECNMDPNETAQRLMSQDTFQEVKRRKDRKKEASSTNKESSEGRSRGSGSYRGGRGGGRGVARYVSSETNGRGKGGAPRENGSQSSVSAPETKPAPPPPQVQLIPQSGSSLSSAGGLSNGSVHYQASGAPTQIPWSKIAGHATMAEMLKSQQSAGALQMPKPQPQRQQAHQAHQPQAPQAPQQQQFPGSGMYSSSDPVHHPSFADHHRSSNVIKREIGIVGNQRSFGDRGGLPSPPSQASSSQDDLRPVSPPQDSNKSQEAPVAVSSAEALRSNGRPPYQPPGTGSKTSGINLEWKPKLAAQDDAPETEALKFPTSSVIPEPEVISVSGKFQVLSTREEHQQVIMPNNFQSQGDLGLSFGSFGESFGSSIPSGFRSEDVIEVSGSPESSVPAKDILHDESPDGADIDAEDDPVDEIPAQRDNLAPNTAPSISSATFTSQADISKLRAQQYSYLQSSQGYSSGIGMVSQIPSSQHVFDSQESHLQDAPIALKQQHYSDSGTSFYSPSFRPSSDGDARYAQYLPTNTKYANGAVVMASQQHLPAHEVSTSSTSSTTSANTHSIQAQQQTQQPVVHAYPAQPTGVPVGHHFGNVFGYQYPYTYMHSPYQHSYTNYPQPPVSSYSPASGNYSPAAAAAVAAAAVKYPVPQYKPGTATANTPISSMSGYGTGYGTGASSMYAGNPGATGGNTPGYEDASGSQYKESNLYMHGPQGDGTRGWNDQASSFYTSQHSSYTQQPSSAHTHPAMASYTSLYHHPGAAAAAAVQQQQAGAAAAAGGHQMMQQPQGLSGAAGSSQVGATTAYHQQLQRMQQQPSWNTY